jgi:two-component system, cell cycle response regulator DivK
MLLNAFGAPTIERPLVLIVDDDRDNREGYAEYLRFAGYRVAQAGTARGALRHALRLHPDVALMDLALPGCDGWELTRRLKGDARTRGIRIIAVSAHVFPADIARAADAGCEAFLAKPCVPEMVEREIQRLLAEEPASGDSSP